MTIQSFSSGQHGPWMPEGKGHLCLTMAKVMAGIYFGLWEDDSAPPGTQAMGDNAVSVHQPLFTELLPLVDTLLNCLSCELIFGKARREDTWAVLQLYDTTQIPISIPISISVSRLTIRLCIVRLVIRFWRIQNTPVLTHLPSCPSF